MNTHVDETLKHFQQLVAELEAMVRSAAGAAGEGSAGLAEQLRNTLATARERLREAEQALEREAARGARLADGYVRDNAWATIGVAAAVAFVLGALVARRD